MTVNLSESARKFSSSINRAALPFAISCLGLVNNIAAKPLHPPSGDPVNDALDLIASGICGGLLALAAIGTVVALNHAGKH